MRIVCEDEVGGGDGFVGVIGVGGSYCAGECIYYRCGVLGVVLEVRYNSRVWCGLF